MNRIYIISFWILGGLVIAVLVNCLASKDIDSILKYSFPFTFAMFSLNFSAISACSNALLKYKECHADMKIEYVISEMKENMIAMLIGIVIVFFASIAKNVDSNLYLQIACNTLIFAVLIMFLHLIIDIAQAFFNIVKN